MKRNLRLSLTLLFLVALVFISATTINNFFMPGSQPGQSGNLETPDRCDNCHGGYDLAVEPAFNWRGGMMSQAARDPLFWACVAIAEQDVPNSGYFCIRCHAPDGWLNGRAIPTDGSALNNNDRQGVQCDFCHKLVKPGPIGTNQFIGDTYYTANTYPADQAYLTYISPNIPPNSANGMFVTDNNNAKRGPFSDATGRHQMFYSPFHSQSAICGTCHDVSNPAFTRADTSIDEYTFNGFDIPASNFDIRYLFPVERTYSEWTISSFNGTGGKTCQDCHMRDVTGKGAKMKDAPIRTNLPLHDMTGGNTFIPDLVKLLFPAEVNAAALDAGKARAVQQLESAADLDLTVVNDIATVKVTNLTGHKLPSGYPEGRRIWVNLKAYQGNSLVYESGAYNYETAVLSTTGTKVYEIKPGFSADWGGTVGQPEGPSFHFAINNKIFFDNRIPPAGATNAELIEIQSPTIAYSYADNQNWDNTTYTLPAGVDRVEARLFYQTASKEYIEFLRDENTSNTRGQEMYDLWAANGKSAPVQMELATWGNVPNPEIIVKDLTVVRKAGKGGNYYAEATVLVTKNNATFSPVAGAAVTATWTYGAETGTATGTTLANGQVVLKTKNIKNATGQWCFTITNVVLTGFTYNAGASVTSACTDGLKNFELFELSDRQNTMRVYPNPVMDVAHISYDLKEEGPVVIEIFNSNGVRLAEIANRNASAGPNTVLWHAEDQPHGIYFVRLTTSQGVLRQTIVVR